MITQFKQAAAVVSVRPYPSQIIISLSLKKLATSGDNAAPPLIKNLNLPPNLSFNLLPILSKTNFLLKNNPMEEPREFSFINFDEKIF